MPRQLRQFEVGGIYHIMNRGYEKRPIYLDDADHIRFIESLYYFNDSDLIVLRDQRRIDKNIRFGKQTPGNRGQTPVTWIERKDEQKPLIELFAFTLMPNHYHLIVREITPGGISRFMQKIGTGYTGYFNEKYDRAGTGGIFQSRYKDIPIQNDRQLGVVFVYVHTNPIELKESSWKDLKVKNARNALNWLVNYRWSSYHDYVGQSTFPNVTQRNFFLDFYGNAKACRQAIDDWVLFKAESAELDPEIFE